jgi:hypothetical protein
VNVILCDFENGTRTFSGYDYDIKHATIIMSKNANPATIRTSSKPTYVYPFRSLNGTVCYREVINSMMGWLENQENYSHVDEKLEMVTNKAESWNMMRMTYLSQCEKVTADVRLFDMEQIIELNNAGTYNNMCTSLLGFRESYRLSYVRQ